jgi:ribosomal protein L7/L12
MPGLRPDQVQQIHEYIHNQQLIHAIKLYRDATGASLAEAKAAVEEMAYNESTKPPDGVMNYDNPILEGRLRSLLAKGRKVDAVKIYREEYGVGLRDAKNAVDRLEASMRRMGGSSAGMPYEPAIGGDPFADSGAGVGGRRAIVLAAAVAVLVCGMGVFFLLLNI